VPPLGVRKFGEHLFRPEPAGVFVGHGDTVERHVLDGETDELLTCFDSLCFRQHHRQEGAIQWRDSRCSTGRNKAKRVKLSGEDVSKSVRHRGNQSFPRMVNLMSLWRVWLKWPFWIQRWLFFWRCRRQKILDWSV